MSSEWCPKCNSTENMNVSVIENIEKNGDEKDVKNTITSYQCSKCHSFIRSEEIKTVMN